MSIAARLFTILGIVMVFLCGCAQSGLPVLPGPDQGASGAMTSPEVAREPSTALGNRYVWGLYEVRIDAQHERIEAVPVRQAGGHWNILKWLEQAPCTECLKITKMAPSGNGTLLVDIQIKHPFSNPNLTGFDVRGIAMFTGSHVFPVSGLNMPDRTLGDGELVNAEGYTTLYNVTTEGSGPNGMQGYFKGKLATATAPNALLNGFKRYVSDDPANTRNAFYAGDTVTVTYEIDMPDGPFVFGYAVDACWVPPIKKPVEDPMTDFPESANCPEAWQISVSDTPISAGLTDCGGKTELTMDVYDWQGEDTAWPVVVECPELLDGKVVAQWQENYAGYSRYESVIENANKAVAASYPCLISKQAKENDPGKPWLDLTAYQVFSVTVAHEPSNPPTAVAEASQTSIPVGVDVSFDAAGSYDNDCGGFEIVKYEWDWNGDGTFVVEPAQTIHHWDSAGVYNVQLRVTDDEGKTDVLDEPIEIDVFVDFIVHFPDPNLEAAIRQAINKPSGDIYYSDLLPLTLFQPWTDNISNLEGLQYCTNLSELGLMGNKITDITPLQNLTSLTFLELSDNQITDITPVQNLHSLLDLGISDQTVADLSPVEHLTALRSLICQFNQVSDITPVKNLTDLTTLNLGGNPIDDISALENLTSLTDLYLFSDGFSDITPLENLTALTRLDLSINNISDIGPLQNLTSITWLRLTANKIVDITPLQDLTSLGQNDWPGADLDLSWNLISDTTPLQNLTSLTQLELAFNSLKSLGPLQNMVALTWLDASYNQITDIAALQYVSSLTYLDLAYNEVSDITALQYPTSLSDIHLLHNQVSDVSPLVSNSGLGSGDSVGLVDNPLSDESKNVYIPQLEAKGVTVSY